jgi:predicted nucleic acid-binding protein
VALTYVLDTSATLAQLYNEPGADIINGILQDPDAVIGISVLTIYEFWTSVIHRAGSQEASDEAVAVLRQSVDVIFPVAETTVKLALELRRSGASRIALADCLIAATAVQHGATLVHRDPHFSVLPNGRPNQLTLPGKA